MGMVYSDNSFVSGRFLGALAFFSGTMSNAPNFFPIFLTGVRPAGSGLI